MTDLELEAQYFKDSLLPLERDIAVRIESKNDIDFWNFTFKNALPSLRPEFYPQSSLSGTKGKSCVMLLKEFADKELVLCVDSDYDYLLQSIDFQYPFVFQTHTYSVENYWSFADGLKNVVENTTYTEGSSDFDFNAFFKNFSEIIYDWLVYSLYSEKINDGQLTPKKCGESIGFNKDLSIKEALKELKTHLNQLGKSFKFYQNQAEFKALKKQFTTLGLTKNNSYLFVRGHDLFDRVTLPLVKKIGEEITNAKFESLKKAGDTEGLKNYADFLKRNTYDSYLKHHNKSFQDHFLFQKIVSDIQKSFN
jgi:hypothetical protein